LNESDKKKVQKKETDKFKNKDLRTGYNATIVILKIMKKGVFKKIRIHSPRSTGS